MLSTPFCFFFTLFLQTHVSIVVHNLEIDTYRYVNQSRPEGGANFASAQGPDFKDLKTILKKEIPLPTTLPIFVKAHLDLLIGGVTIFKSKLTQFFDENIDKSTVFIKKSTCYDVEWKCNLCDNAETVGNSCNSCNENWMGLGNDPKHKNFKWINYDEKSIMFEDDSLRNPRHASIDKISDFGPNDDVNEFRSTFKNDNNVVTVSLNQSIENDHNYSLKTSPPLTNNNRSNVLDAAVNMISRQVKNEGKYFKEFAEVKLLNNLIAPKTHEENLLVKKSEKRLKKSEEYLLMNGNLSGPVKFENNFWFTYNTCPFDSIIQVLFNGSLENKQFYEFLNNSKNSTCKFVTEFMKTGLTSEIYLQRFSILYSIYNSQEKKQIKLLKKNKENEVARNISRVIDCEDNVSSLWSKLFSNEPSLFQSYSCSSPDCLEFQTNSPLLTVNYKTIIDNGFNDLEKALNFSSVIYNTFCKNCRNRTQTCQRTLNSYIYIELDIKLIEEKQGRCCKLQDLPTYLNFEHQSLSNGESKLCYRLCGTIGYNEHHYIAYCRRITGEWRSYNDLLKKPIPIGSHTRILPHGVLYLLDNGIGQ